MAQDWWSAISTTLDGYTIFLIFVGTLAGILAGSTPGISATMGVAVLVPFTFGMSSSHALAVLAAVFCGAMYGGSIPSILINIPGTPAALATNMDGYPLARKGQAGRAIGVATVASVTGGIMSLIILMVAAPLVARFALRFSAPEYFALAMFGLSIIANLSGDSLVKGLLAGALGLGLSLIGFDPVTGQARFTFGSPSLLNGIGLVPALIGLYGMAEVISNLCESQKLEVLKQQISGVIPSRDILRRVARTVLRSGLIGTFIGVVPAAGAPIASLLAYNEAKRTSKHSASFGKGEVEGIAAAEAANNATTGGALVPLLTLGIPGDGVTAVMLGAFMIHNLQPGPLLFERNAAVVYSLYAALLLANVFLLVLGLSGARLFARVLMVPHHLLMPAIALLCVVGSYAVRNSMFDVGVMLCLGFVGYLMGRAGVPVAPMVLGLVLGPLAEANFRRALLVSRGDLTVFVTRPISAIFLVATVLMIAYPLIKRYLARSRQPVSAVTESTSS